MVHIIIGTKAQFIKMAPLIQRLQKKNIPFNLIDLGQHSLITKELRKEFEIREPDIYLSKGEDIAHLSRGILWFMYILLKSLSSGWIRKNVFLNKKGICLIHGDTASTLLGLYLAKRVGLKVAHLEAGLRSFCWFEPFPEEILRVMAMRFSDILFAPSKWALGNLKNSGLEKKAVLVSANTSLESTFYSLNKQIELGSGLKKFALITVHRMENIFFKKKLLLIIGLIQHISSYLPIVFVQHPSTINYLRKFGLVNVLNKVSNVHFLKILSHTQFIHLLNRCEFVITDGGSIQEESFYLNKPCLLLRNYTERTEGLGENVVISKFSEEKINYFLNNYKTLKRKEYLNTDMKPSEEIIGHILRMEKEL